MCIKIVNAQQEISYDADRPLEEQIAGCEQIIVNYEPFDTKIDKFLQEVDRFSRTGVNAKLSIKVIHNNNIFGFKIKQKLKQATDDMVLNDIIKLMVLSQIETDSKLKELSETCLGMVR